MKKFMCLIVAIMVSVLCMNNVVFAKTAEIKFTPYTEMPGDDFKECPLDDNLQKYIYNLCKKNHISYSFVISVIWRESMFDADAKNGSCKGLMQINEKVHKDRMEKLGVTDLYDPYQNVKVGVDYLLELFEKYEDCYLVLMAYNCGETRAQSLWNKGIYSSKYAVWICDRAMELTDMYGY